MKSGALAIKILVTVLVLAGLVACRTIGYYSQAARGQLAILWNREPINALLANEELPTELRQKLSTILEIRQFATEELLLPAGGSYLAYVELDRQHVVWNVFAAPEFSVEPVNWCYPVAGCVSYRGYFSEDAALDFAGRLQQQGYDVYTGGVDAYSTLGWFDDPVLSTVITRQDYQLAALIFHELAHQLVYVSGDTTFNESFATAVEQEGLKRWLDMKGDADSLERAYRESERRQQFVELVIDFRERFAALYRQRVAPSLMRERKEALQDEMRAAYRELNASWGGIGAYDAWFARSLNNAQLSTVSSYNELVPAFEGLLQDQANDLQAFYGMIQEIAELSREDREDRMQPRDNQ